MTRRIELVIFVCPQAAYEHNDSSSGCDISRKLASHITEYGRIALMQIYKAWKLKFGWG